MNMFAAYTQTVPGGYRVMLRFSKDGNPKPIMDVGDKPLVVPTKLEATQTALAHLLDYLNGDYQRCGERLPTAVSEAEKQFGAIFMKGRAIPIERKERAKA